MNIKNHNLLKNFKNKKIIITGNTGFKGSWLSLIFAYCGAKVLGISYGKTTKPSLFHVLKLNNRIKCANIDVKNYTKFKNKVETFKPDFIFHLAAEAIVKRAYAKPLLTWETNTLGTINLLEILRTTNHKIVTVFITSDKVYRNEEISRGYKETDILGDYDPYGASKASADLAIQSYTKSFLYKKNNLRIGIARAGNIIGGGDWSEGRLLPDIIKNWSKNKKLIIRNPNSTRPWQHVFEIISGYLILALRLKKQKLLNGQSFNFGPSSKNSIRVIDIVKYLKTKWVNAKFKIKRNKNLKEASLLKLNSKKSKKLLKWKTKLTLIKTLDYTIDWYREYYKNPKRIYQYSLDQLQIYFNLK